MNLIVKGEAVVFGDNVNTDVIIPGRYLTTLDPEELARHAMEGLDPEFPSKARRGVIVVAGRNFGCGSSREQAPLALKYAGVRCILAESFARIFYRNAVNIGLPVLECPGISGMVSPGDRLTVNLAEGKVRNDTKGLTFQALKLPEFLLNIIKDGGLIEHLKRRLGRRGHV
ncbi:3-isopropylmalate dehydratase small subunit [Candidatus Bathyarchaeota archaeon]|nr:MAG: 3-isopropylmalate dehydratase small subunit [Candidatus Bathyarchaeota archaeon ex4484_40]RJS68015.1 MAG: 3-isopropylmalate dehydratase small subunit [Candidatus Bathyarchaeota archaeon]RJS79872.1 MAG: 3-isopropylmalate dehydratase small subunit [Candidatus Bathyarchaeota archaeon]RLG98656.1 MAG: 3-isopropylmalate dehydratase small subunit [Candidatus Bathyarchaeota archaeon]HDJ04372.1 3-isopropylmalate dehydratase small subunit [Candidatus Bathyarchaeota archaeon]